MSRRPARLRPGAATGSPTPQGRPHPRHPRHIRQRVPLRGVPPERGRLPPGAPPHARCGRRGLAPAPPPGEVLRRRHCEHQPGRHGWPTLRRLVRRPVIGAPEAEALPKLHQHQHGAALACRAGLAGQRGRSGSGRTTCGRRAASHGQSGGRCRSARRRGAPATATGRASGSRTTIAVVPDSGRRSRAAGGWLTPRSRTRAHAPPTGPSTGWTGALVLADPVGGPDEQVHPDDERQPQGSPAEMVPHSVSSSHTSAKCSGSSRARRSNTRSLTAARAWRSRYRSLLAVFRSSRLASWRARS